MKGTKTTKCNILCEVGDINSRQGTCPTDLEAIIIMMIIIIIFIKDTGYVYNYILGLLVVFGVLYVRVRVRVCVSVCVTQCFILAQTLKGKQRGLLLYFSHKPLVLILELSNETTIKHVFWISSWCASRYHNKRKWFL